MASLSAKTLEHMKAMNRLKETQKEEFEGFVEYTQRRVARILAANILRLWQDARDFHVRRCLERWRDDWSEVMLTHSLNP